MQIQARQDNANGNLSVMLRNGKTSAVQLVPPSDSQPWLLQAVMDQLPSAGVILDESGTVLYVNKAMRALSGAQWPNLQDCHEGQDFLADCPAIFHESVGGAALVKAGVRRVMAGEQLEVSLDLACLIGATQKCVRVRVIRLGQMTKCGGFRVLVVREEITLEKRVERALRGQAELQQALQTARAERKKAEETLQELSGRLINAQEHERTRIARELHDDLNQRLALISIDLEQYGQQLPRSIEEHRCRTREIWARAHEISAEIHRISYQLHPSKLETLGLVAAVKAFCQELSERKALKVVFVHRHVPTSIPNDISLCLFRVMQEALSNAIKHSGAQTARVELVGTARMIHLRVSDAGSGVNVEKFRTKPGLGMVSMQERLRLVGGEFMIESSVGQGTSISAQVPLANPTET